MKKQFRILISVHALAQIAEQHGVSSDPDPAWPDPLRVQHQLCDPDLHAWVTPWIMDKLNALSYKIHWLEDSTNHWEHKKRPWIEMVFADQTDWALLKMQHSFEMSDYRIIGETR